MRNEKQGCLAMNRNIYDYVPGKPYSAGQVINASSSRHMQAIAQATGSAEPELTLGFWQLGSKKPRACPSGQPVRVRL